MESKEKISILMEEYKTLRSEIVVRLTHRFAFLGLFIISSGIAASNYDEIGLSLPLLLLPAGALLLIWYIIGTLISSIAARLREIESEVNSMAGEELLVWETRQSHVLMRILNNNY